MRVTRPKKWYQRRLAKYCEELFCADDVVTIIEVKGGN